MHDKIHNAIEKKISPLEFLKTLVEVLEDEKEELSQTIEFYKSLDYTEDNIINTRRMELLNSFIIRKGKYIEFSSEINSYIQNCLE